MSMVEEKSSRRKEKWRWTRSSVKSEPRWRLAFKMQQEAKVHWRYEWPLKRTTKWPVQKLLVKRKQQVLKRWLRHAENLSHKGKRSGRGLIGFQVGNEKRISGSRRLPGGQRRHPEFPSGKGRRYELS
jgi:hypothetical protein